MITFTVRGKPEPQGSTRSFYKNGKTITTSANPKLKDWRGDVAKCAQDYAPATLWTGPIAMTLNFTLLRPRSVTWKRRPYPTTKPDADKLTRAVWDALKGIFYVDDAQIVRLVLSKDYGDAPSVVIAVEEMS